MARCKSMVLNELQTIFPYRENTIQDKYENRKNISIFDLPFPLSLRNSIFTSGAPLISNLRLSLFLRVRMNAAVVPPAGIDNCNHLGTMRDVKSRFAWDLCCFCGELAAQRACSTASYLQIQTQDHPPFPIRLSVSKFCVPADCRKRTDFQRPETVINHHHSGDRTCCITIRSRISATNRCWHRWRR